MSSDPTLAPTDVTEPPAAPGSRRGLRRILIVAVLGFLGSCGSCVGCFVVGSRASTEGAAFARETIVLVSQPWNAEALVSRAAPELLQTTSREKLVDFVAFISRRLGPLRAAGPMQNGQWRVYVGTKGPAVFTSHFSDCEFERGPGRVTVQLVRRGDTWQVLSFHINSDLLMKDDPR